MALNVTVRVQCSRLLRGERDRARVRVGVQIYLIILTKMMFQRLFVFSMMQGDSSEGIECIALVICVD